MAVGTHVAFVRAVMIGRDGLHREVLLECFGRAGAANAASHLATGNVSFEVDAESLPDLIDRVERDLELVLGREAPLYVRSLDELAELVARDPFVGAPFDDVYARIVTFFRARVPTTFELPLVAANGDWSVFGAGPRELFSVTRAWPDRQPQDPGGVIQKLAGEPVTSRAIGTIERIVRRLTD
jgi:uncharacterized protein (DUF1697 family)